MNRDIIAFTKYKFNVYGNKDIRSGKDSAVVGIVGKSKSLDFPTMLIFWSLVRNSVVLAVYLLFSVACFLTVHEHHSKGQSKGRAFLNGVLSGAVEPLGALLMIFFAPIFAPYMPIFLSFAAGAMLYVVVEELIPEMSEGEHSNVGVLLFALGFTVMMALDVALS